MFGFGLPVSLGETERASFFIRFAVPWRSLGTMQAIFMPMKGAYMNSDLRVIRGLGIATIVLSSLGIAGGLVIALFMGIASTSLNDPAVVSALVSELQASGSSSSAFDGSSAYSYDFPA